MSIRSLSAAAVLAALSSPGSASGVWINEIHYDNAGSDVGEFVELAGPAGTDLTGWSLNLYNGLNGEPYAGLVLADVLPDDVAGFGFLSVDFSSIQNGAPDGLALVEAGGDVVQFLSYEGVMTATAGPAAGLTSTDIGVFELGTTPVGSSLQLAGIGIEYADFDWIGPAIASPDGLNAQQALSAVPIPAALPLFASALGLIGVLGRRRSRGGAAEVTARA